MSILSVGIVRARDDSCNNAIKSPQVTPGYDEHMSPLQDLLASAVELDPVVDDPAGVFSGTTVSGRLLSVPMPSFGQR